MIGNSPSRKDYRSAFLLSLMGTKIYMRDLQGKFYRIHGPQARSGPPIYQWIFPGLSSIILVRPPWIPAEPPWP